MAAVASTPPVVKAECPGVHRQLDAVLQRVADRRASIQELAESVRQLGKDAQKARKRKDASFGREVAGRVERAQKLARNFSEDLVEDMLVLDNLSGLACEDRRRRKATLAELEGLVCEVDPAKKHLAALEGELRADLEGSVGKIQRGGNAGSGSSASARQREARGETQKRRRRRVVKNKKESGVPGVAWNPRDDCWTITTPKPRGGKLREWFTASLYKTPKGTHEAAVRAAMRAAIARYRDLVRRGVVNKVEARNVAAHRSAMKGVSWDDAKKAWVIRVMREGDSTRKTVRPLRNTAAGIKRARLSAEKLCRKMQ